LVALYVTSSEEATGKTTIGAGVGKHLVEGGKKVGFLKPIIAESPSVEKTDRDASFMKHILALAEPVDLLCPAVQLLPKKGETISWAALISRRESFMNQIREAYAQISQGKDVIIVEGRGEPSQASRRIAQALNAKVIIVEDYSNRLSMANLITSSEDFGERLLGVVLNKVPGNKLEPVAGELRTQLGKAGINVLGVLPEDRLLFTLTVGELAEHLQGEILNSTEKSAELVENFMLGAMGLDLAPDYFSRKSNKAVIVRGKRSDMQLTALETSTRCLVLTGKTAPIPEVIARAKDKEVPMILVKEDTATTVTNIEEALSQTRFNQEQKLPRLAEIMQQHFNFQALCEGLGLAR